MAVAEIAGTLQPARPRNCTLHTVRSSPLLLPTAFSDPTICLCNPRPRSAGIYDTLKECACISKSAGGIGLAMHNIRATGARRGRGAGKAGLGPRVSMR